LAIATVDFIASFWLLTKVKARAFVVMPFVIMAVLTVKVAFGALINQLKPR
jgi:hypothetical protein